MGPLKKQVLTVVTECCGRILDYKNLTNHRFCSEIEKGIAIDNIIPVLHGYFPMTTKTIILENVSFEDFHGNIIIINNLSETIIEFHLNTTPSKEWTAILQKYNQEKLIKKLSMKTNSTPLDSKILKTLGFIVFEHTEQGFILSGSVPSWFQDLFPNYNYSSSLFELTELFPFLEVFIPDAKYLYESKSDGKLLSGLWAEYNPNNSEIILQATAVKGNSSNLFLIESISERFPNQQKNIQHARETILEHQQLVKTEKKLRLLFENQEQFISIFSHDIRGPLSGAFALLEILKKDQSFMQNFNSKQNELFGVMHKGLKDLYEYAYRLHDWSKVHFGNVNLEIAQISFYDLVISLNALLTEQLAEKKITIKIDVPKQTTIQVDQPFFKNALHNLLTNAIKFSHIGSEITVSAKTTENEVIIQVIDKGLGIPERFRRTLFDFNKKHSSKGTKGERGSGIGLTVVKRIIDLHEGKITVNSEINKGTTIGIILPK